MVKKTENLPKEDRNSRERFSVGIDIGSSSVKAVRLKFLKGNGVEFCGFYSEPIQPDLGAFLKKVPQSQNTAISVYGPQVVIRYAHFPKMNIKELKQALKFEAQKHIPFPLGEVNLDSYILKEAQQDNQMLVLLAAVKKEFINQRLKLMEKAGLKINIVDIDSLALVNAFNFNYSNENNGLKNKIFALLNIGASMSNLNILENGLPVLSRDIPTAGNNFTQKIIDALGTDFKSAESLKLNPGDDKERQKKVSQACEAMLSNLAAEIRTSFDYYESQSSSSVATIFLSGGSSLFAGLKDTLANYLDIGVEYWDPLRQITIPNNLDSKEIKALSGQLAVAVGLALRSKE